MLAAPISRTLPRRSRKSRREKPESFVTIHHSALALSTERVSVNLNCNAKV
ncbi:hypothetical protein FHY03_003672 [Sphingomonas sp. BK345]|nr:hypothetical protein [Sphingomonas sp. BK345]